MHRTESPLRPKLCLLIAACCLLTASIASSQEPAATGEWVQLFNGKNLEGWTPKIRGHELGHNFGGTFRVENGAITVSYEHYDTFDERFGHLFYDKPFSNYRLRVEYRFVGEQNAGGPGWAIRNSGVMIHGQDPATMTKDQDFPVSIEAQLLGGDGKRARTTHNLCTPGTHVVIGDDLVKRHCINSKSKTYHGEQWVTAEIEVIGNRIRHIMEGEVVLEYRDPQLDPADASARRLIDAGAKLPLRGGTISLQSESHPVEFRKVEILELPAPKGTPDEDGWADLFEGDELLAEWKTQGNWKLAGGVATLTPRPGESGWKRYDAYLWSRAEYTDFEAEFEYKLEKKGNSGFYFHVGDRDDPVARGIEVQLYDSHSRGADAELNDHDAGGIIPGFPPSRHAAHPAGEWNRLRVRCRGHHLVVWLNDVQVNEVMLDHPRLDERPKRGAIGFQDHGLPISLRGFRVRRL